MGQSLPLFQLAVKTLKVFHNCTVCQLAWIAKCVNTMETNEKRIRGSHNGGEVRDRVHQQLAMRKKRKKERGGMQIETQPRSFFHYQLLFWGLFSVFFLNHSG